MSQINPMSHIYMTTEEFADLLVEILEDSNYFKRGVKAHPEDILFALVPAAEAVVASSKYFGRKMAAEMNSQEKKAMMQTGDLSKEDSVLGYSEYKHGVL